MAPPYFPVPSSGDPVHGIMSEAICGPIGYPGRAAAAAQASLRNSTIADITQDPHQSADTSVPSPASDP